MNTGRHNFEDEFIRTDDTFVNASSTSSRLGFQHGPLWGVTIYMMIQMLATKFLPEMAFSNQEVEAERVPAFEHYTQKATLDKLSKTIHYTIIMIIS